MRKFLAGLMLAIMLTTSMGCATWWANFKANPAAQVAAVVDTIHTIVNIADIVFGTIKPQIPQADQADAQAAFDKAVLAVNHAVGVLQAAVQTAVDQGQGLDISKLFADATKAADELQALIDALRAKQTPAAATMIGVSQNQSHDELVFQIGLLHRQTK